MCMWGCAFTIFEKCLYLMCIRTWFTVSLCWFNAKCVLNKQVWLCNGDGSEGRGFRAPAPYLGVWLNHTSAWHHSPAHSSANNYRAVSQWQPHSRVCVVVFNWQKNICIGPSNHWQLNQPIAKWRQRLITAQWLFHIIIII